MMVGRVFWPVLLLSFVASVHSITLQQCDAYNYAYHCYNKLRGQMAAAFLPVEYCQAVKTYIACVEYVGCECNMTLSINLAKSLTDWTHFYRVRGCIQVTKELDETKGIPCDKWDNTTGSTEGELLVLSTSVSAYVTELEKNCTGFQSCYEGYDTNAALALHNRNLTELCRVSDDHVTCLETAACSCNGTNDTSIQQAVASEDAFYLQTCQGASATVLLPRSDINCTEEDKVVTPPVCLAPDPVYTCYVDLLSELNQNGYSLQVYCPATRTYINCVEDIACQCRRLLRHHTVYQALTNAINSYNKYNCLSVSGPVNLSPGIQCPDGTGTGDDEDRIVLSFAELPFVERNDKWCQGVKKCYQDLDERNGVALFERNHQKACVNSKLFVECMEDTYCQCGVHYSENGTASLYKIQAGHNSACSETSLRDDFMCSNIALEECEIHNYPGRCYSTLQTKIRGANTKFEFCEAVKNFINCTEVMGCACNLTLNYGLADSLTYNHYYYGSQGCPAIAGELPDTKGIPCDKWGSNTGSTDGQLLVLSESVSPYVVALEKNCTGFQSCYAVFDTEAALALHSRNFTVLCGVLDELVSCLETSACGCDGGNSTAIVKGVLTEDAYYRRTCQIVKGDDLYPRLDIKCDENGTSVPRTICHTLSPTYKCKDDFDRTRSLYGTSLAAQCPGTKTYTECVESIACQCGLIREAAVYLDLTDAIAYYNRTCVSESGPITVIPGMKCSDGSGTRENEYRLVMELAIHPIVVMHNGSCQGLQQCHDDLEVNYGTALFEKHSQRICRSMEMFYECMAVTLCQCNLYDDENTTMYLDLYRWNHNKRCMPDTIVTDDFECKYGSIGLKCIDNNDCEAVKNAVCSSNSTCDCKEKYLFSPSKAQCMDVYNGDIGSQCRDTADCQTVSNSTCGIAGVCSCQSGYRHANNTCNPVSSAMKMTPAEGLLTGVLLFYITAIRFS